MERDGWLRLVSGSDSRSRTAALVAKGRLVLAAADPLWARTQGAVIDRFGRDRWQKLVTELKEFTACAAARQSTEDNNA
jgi:hypothetical protein